MAETNTLARPYARALFEYALESDQLPSWSDRLSRLAALAGVAEVAVALDNPELTAKGKVDLLADLLGKDQAGLELSNFLNVLAENGRLSLLPSISAQFETLRAEREKTVEVVVTSSYELTEEQQDLLRKTLADRLDRQVKLETRTDSTLLGGVYIQAGDTVIDASLRGRLARLAQTMNS